jgi:large subunit ribosomal protein L21
MFAVIRTGGKQYKVAEGETVRVESLEADVNSAVDFSEVLAVHDGTDLKMGTPLIEAAKVSAKVVRHGRGKKIIVFTKKRRKGQSCKQGHRQNFTEVRIQSISAG